MPLYHLSSFSAVINTDKMDVRVVISTGPGGIFGNSGELETHMTQRISNACGGLCIKTPNENVGKTIGIWYYHYRVVSDDCYPYTSGDLNETPPCSLPKAKFLSASGFACPSGAASNKVYKMTPPYRIKGKVSWTSHNTSELVQLGYKHLLFERRKKSWRRSWWTARFKVSW